VRTKSTKETLTSAFYAETSTNYGIDRLIAKFEKRLAKEHDAELLFMLQSLRAWLAELEGNDFRTCCAIATPLFEHLTSCLNWSYMELFVLSRAITAHQDFNKTRSLFQEALDLLNDEEYVNDEKYKMIGFTMHFNMTMRIIRAKYHDPGIDMSMLDDLFARCHDHVMEVYVRKNLPHQHILKIRRGVYENDMDMINDGLSDLYDVGDKKLYKIIKDEVAEYLTYMDDELGRPLTTYLLGYQLRKRRSLLRLTTMQFADLLETDQTTINAIERGEDGVSLERLRRICKILKVSADYFLGIERTYESEDIFLTQFKARFYKATDAQKELILKHTDVVLGG